MGRLYSTVGTVRKRVIVAALAAAIAGLAAIASSASASAIVPTSTWSGASTSSSNWTDSANWGGTAPSSGNGLAFPNLGSCTTPAACYLSTNDETDGFSVNGITIDDGTPYDITQATANSITLGAAGVTANATTMNASAGTLFDLPITLGADQIWSIAGGGANQGVNFTQAITGTTHTLGINLNNGGLFGFKADDEVGNVTITGSDIGETGTNAVNNGIVETLSSSAKLNATSGSGTVALKQAALIGKGSIGKLTSTGGEIQVGSDSHIVTIGSLSFTGDVTLDGQSATLFTIKNAATAAGTDFGQLTAATHTVALDGTLEILLSHFTCPTLNVGDVYTLVSAGSVTGTFTGIPDGRVIQTTNTNGCAKQPSLRINYTSTTVTATVVNPTPTPTPTGPAATPPANQTAPVASGSDVAGGTVSTTNGVWGGTTPMSFALQWQRCDVTCSNILGATGSSYKLTNADLNKHVRAVVAASNSAGGPVFAVSNQIGPVKAPLIEIDNLLLTNIVPKGKADSIKAILKAGGAVLTVTAVEPGAEKISWYFLPPGAHIARAHHPKPVLVATGRIVFNAPGSAHLKLKLTKAGKRLLRHAHRMKLTAKGTFTPKGQSGVSAKKKFSLKR